MAAGPSSSDCSHTPATFPSIETASNLAGCRTSWRHKDSSENTPSSVDNDDAAYIVPAIPASSLLRGSIPVLAEEGSYAHINNSAGPPPISVTQRSTSPASTASGVADPSGLREVMPWVQDDGIHTAGVECEDTDHSASIISPPLRVLVYRRQQKLKEQEKQGPTRQTASGPILAPLQPQYTPPRRRPTPPGVPSFESANRTLESRLALRRYDTGQPMHNTSNTSTVRTSSNGLSNGPFSNLSL
ncbi:uncharacterized protein SPSK_01943 [Sporothrix schenckii 1099-18]|uniref:Uncharacterized protein n=1 Tax=Sporothrix schenckii 1099-18 TaxID=1397361 RepID=A0A0F2MCE5_SPOSC|nr:uncharacterized protein SPSK_01943 [Sporothrix schenckii 1099-18]KJR87378.1 hypothetical protein SPSK_01943 [Sporothrix schenckii 1099-18]